MVAAPAITGSVVPADLAAAVAPAVDTLAAQAASAAAAAAVREITQAAVAGFGAGSGGSAAAGSSSGGGGGLGAGGAVFVQQGGSLTIGSGSETGGSVTGGTGGGGVSAGTGGSALGSGIFVQNENNAASVLTFTPALAQSVTIGDVITDMMGSGAGSGQAAVLMSGAGTLILGGRNSYTGTTTIDAGTVDLTGDTSLLTGGISDNSELVFGQTAASSFSGVISGSGGVSQNGSGRIDAVRR